MRLKEMLMVLDDDTRITYTCRRICWDKNVKGGTRMHAAVLHMIGTEDITHANAATGDSLGTVVWLSISRPRCMGPLAGHSEVRGYPSQSNMTA